MGAAPEAYDLAQAAPAMIDCMLCRPRRPAAAARTGETCARAGMPVRATVATRPAIRRISTRG